MTLPSNIGAYKVELDTFDRAVADPTGIRITFGKDVSGAKLFLLRLHQARSLDRQNSRRLYEKSDVRHGNSSYDGFVCRLREDTEGDWWVYIERRTLDEGRIESLTEEAS